jgi:hypothetical protein
LYINPRTLGYELMYNSRGFLYRARHGEISYTAHDAEAIANAKIYIDIASGELNVMTYATGNRKVILDDLRREAQEIIDTVSAEIAASEADADDSASEIVAGSALTEEQIDELLNVGFYYKGGLNRLYMDTRAAGLREMAWGFTFRGSDITHERGRQLMKSETYIDLNTAQIHSDCEEMAQAARELVDAANAGIRKYREYTRWFDAHRDEIQAAHKSGNMFPECKIVRFCEENGIDVPADMTGTIDALNREYSIREKRPEFSSDGWAYTVDRILNDWRDGTLA